MKSNIHKNKLSPSRWMITLVTLLRRRITKENTLQGFKIQFEPWRFFNMHNANTTKNPRKNRKQQRHRGEHLNTSFVPQHLGRKPINEEGNNLYCIILEDFGNIHFKHQCSNSLHEMHIFAFSHSILLGSTSTYCLMNDVMLIQVGMKCKG